MTSTAASHGFPAGSAVPAAVESITVRKAPSHLAAAIVCGIYRGLRTPRGAALDVPSSVPGNVYACLNIVARGQVRPATGGAAPLPGAFLCGPFSESFVNVAQAPLASLSVVLQPWVLHAWFGLEPAGLRDAWCDARVLQPRGALAAGFLAAAARAARGPAQWCPAFAALPPADVPAPDGALARHLEQAGSVARAAQACGVGVRQFHRLFVQAHGLAPRRWLALRQSEQALVRLLQPAAAADASLAGLAGETGYADQAHMTRTLRRLAGATPLGLREAVAGNVPGLWAAKVAADVRIVQDTPQPPA